MNTFILTMLIALIPQNHGGGASGMAAVTVEYESEKACKEALDLNRRALVKGDILLATCTRK